MINDIMKLLHEAEVTAPQDSDEERLGYMAKYLIDNGVRFADVIINNGNVTFNL